MVKCTCVDWREQRQEVFDHLEELKEDDQYMLLGDDEQDWFVAQTQKLLEKVMDEDSAIEMEKEEFLQIVQELDEVMAQVLSKNAERLAEEKRASQVELREVMKLREQEIKYTQVQINCINWMNPIVPDLISGYLLKTYSSSR